MAFLLSFLPLLNVLLSPAHKELRYDSSSLLPAALAVLSHLLLHVSLFFFSDPSSLGSLTGCMAAKNRGLLSRCSHRMEDESFSPSL